MAVRAFAVIRFYDGTEDVFRLECGAVRGDELCDITGDVCRMERRYVDKEGGIVLMSGILRNGAVIARVLLPDDAVIMGEGFYGHFNEVGVLHRVQRVPEY